LAAGYKQQRLALCLLTVINNKKEKKFMSAFIVNKTHIDAIVTAIVDCPNINISRSESNIDLVGQILWDENFKSVNYRYSDNEQAPKYSHRVKYVSLAQAIKAISCLNYQSCEHPDYYGFCRIYLTSPQIPQT
jgi:hypothetical protein